MGYTDFGITLSDILKQRSREYAQRLLEHQRAIDELTRLKSAHAYAMDEIKATGQEQRLSNMSASESRIREHKRNAINDRNLRIKNAEADAELADRIDAHIEDLQRQRASKRFSKVLTGVDLSSEAVARNPHQWINTVYERLFNGLVSGDINTKDATKIKDGIIAPLLSIVNDSTPAQNLNPSQRTDVRLSLTDAWGKNDLEHLRYIGSTGWKKFGGISDLAGVRDFGSDTANDEPTATKNMPRVWAIGRVFNAVLSGDAEKVGEQLNLLEKGKRGRLEGEDLRKALLKYKRTLADSDNAKIAALVANKYSAGDSDTYTTKVRAVPLVRQGIDDLIKKLKAPKKSTEPSVSEIRRNLTTITAGDTLS